MSDTGIEWDALGLKETIEATDEILVVSPDNPRTGRGTGAMIYRVGGTDVAVADGGTGASNPSGARDNLDVYSREEIDAALAIASSAIETSSGTVVLDGEVIHRVWALHEIDGAITYETDNLFDGLEFTIQLIETDSSDQSISFPVGWTWFGSLGEMTILAADSQALVSVRCNGALDTDVVAAWTPSS